MVQPPFITTHCLERAQLYWKLRRSDFFFFDVIVPNTLITFRIIVRISTTLYRTHVIIRRGVPYVYCTAAWRHWYTADALLWGWKFVFSCRFIKVVMDFLFFSKWITSRRRLIKVYYAICTTIEYTINVPILRVTSVWSPCTWMCASIYCFFQKRINNTLCSKTHCIIIMRRFFCFDNKFKIFCIFLTKQSLHQTRCTEQKHSGLHCVYVYKFTEEFSLHI